MIRFAKLLILTGLLAVGVRSASAQTGQFVGEIRTVGFNFAPIGWQLCQGQLLSIQENTALFSLLGTQYGGDGIHNFALPNLQGRFPLGMGGIHPIGQAGGAETYSLSVAQLPAHSHPLMASMTEANVASPEGNVLSTKARVPLYVSGTPNAVMSTESIGATGGNQPYAVMPPYTTINYIIALEGIYPSRP